MKKYLFKLASSIAAERLHTLSLESIYGNNISPEQMLEIGKAFIVYKKITRVHYCLKNIAENCKHYINGTEPITWQMREMFATTSFFEYEPFQEILDQCEELKHIFEYEEDLFAIIDELPQLISNQLAELRNEPQDVGFFEIKNNTIAEVSKEERLRHLESEYIQLLVDRQINEHFFKEVELISTLAKEKKDAKKILKVVSGRNYTGPTCSLNKTMFKTRTKAPYNFPTTFSIGEKVMVLDRLTQQGDVEGIVVDIFFHEDLLFDNKLIGNLYEDGSWDSGGIFTVITPYGEFHTGDGNGMLVKAVEMNNIDNK